MNTYKVIVAVTAKSPEEAQQAVATTIYREIGRGTPVTYQSVSLPDRSPMTVIDRDAWEPCSPEYLANGGSCDAPRVWDEASKNHWHPRLPDGGKMIEGIIAATDRIADQVGGAFVIHGDNTVTADDAAVHLSHCFQGEYQGCKYGDEDCPAAPEGYDPNKTSDVAAQLSNHLDYLRVQCPAIADDIEAARDVIERLGRDSRSMRFRIYALILRGDLKPGDEEVMRDMVAFLERFEEDAT